MQSIIKLRIVVPVLIVLLVGCNLPKPKEKTTTLREKHNYIILLDLSDRLIVQSNQVDRDKQIINHLYSLFENKVKKDLYIRSRDEIKVVIAPQRGSDLDRYVFEDSLYFNMTKIKNFSRRAKEEERRNKFTSNVDALYQRAVFSKNSQDYYGADIWKYFYEDLKVDYSKDSLTQNYLFILTDGYPIVGSEQTKLLDIKNEFPDLHIVLIEAAPREKDLEWDGIMAVWEDWFKKIGIKDYTLIKRGAISKELEQIEQVLGET